jgi:PPOX class probable F420-dependent enzyme
MPALTSSERDAFLREPGIILKLATVGPDGMPLVVPIWFIYEEGRIWFTPRQHSEWLGHLRRDPRVALCIDEQALPYRKVVAQGRAEIAYECGRDAEWRDRYRRIARRYTPPDAADAYVDGTDDQPRALCALDLARAKLRTWRMPVGDEPYPGIWARRYWTEDAKIRAQAPPVVTRPR